MAGVYEKVKKLAEELGVDFEIIEDGRDALRKGQRVVRTIRYAQFGLKTTEEIIKEYKDLRKKYDFNKLVYRVSTVGGHSRLYLIKKSK